MSEQLQLVAAGNTYNPCLLALRGKGYLLWAENSGERTLWNASKGGQSFMAYTPPELAGIVLLWETYGLEWNRQHPNLLDEVLKQASNNTKIN